MNDYIYLYWYIYIYIYINHHTYIYREGADRAKRDLFICSTLF